MMSPSEVSGAKKKLPLKQWAVGALVGGAIGVAVVYFVGWRVALDAALQRGVRREREPADEHSDRIALQRLCSLPRRRARLVAGGSVVGLLRPTW